MAVELSSGAIGCTGLHKAVRLHGYTAGMAALWVRSERSRFFASHSHVTTISFLKTKSVQMPPSSKIFLKTWCGCWHGWHGWQGCHGRNSSHGRSGRSGCHGLAVGAVVGDFFRKGDRLHNIQKPPL